MNRRWSFRNASGAPFELWISVVTMVNVIAFFARPTANPIHVLAAPWDAVWAVVYGLAGVLIFIGLVRARSAQFEAAGLVLLLGGIAVQLVVFGSFGVATLTGTWGTMVTLGTLALIALWRFRMIARFSRRLIDADDSHPEEG